MANARKAIRDLKGEGFEGFVPMQALRDPASRRLLTPREPGVYVVVRESAQPPSFLPRSPAGHYRGDPTCPDVESFWIVGEPVVYIGQTRRTVRERLSEFVRFGAGMRVAHTGGKRIWQLGDAWDLLVCWRAIVDTEPRAVEDTMLVEFMRGHAGRLPYANDGLPRRRKTRKT